MPNGCQTSITELSGKEKDQQFTYKMQDTIEQCCANGKKYWIVPKESQTSTTELSAKEKHQKCWYMLQDTIEQYCSKGNIS